MKRLLNTLFVQTQGAYLRKEGDAVVVRIEKKTALRVPLHQLDGVVTFGQVSASPFLQGACARAGVRFSMLDRRGRFLAAVQGFSPGNVLLRREQYRRADSEEASLLIARPIVAAKIANTRTVLLRAARDHPSADPTPDAGRPTDPAATAQRMADDARLAMTATSLDRLRGVEGESGASYFRAFDGLIRAGGDAFRFEKRSRRPPLNRTNALLSFLYTLLAHDCRSACEAAGLDAAVGFLHRDRPGRPSLALDLMESLRPVLADRLTLSLINRGQVKAGSFEPHASGAVFLTEAGRRTALTAYQERKRDELMHPFIGEKIELGLVPHVQARLLARHLRGDHDAYPDFLWR
ncbi:type I-C CRISPR-associated endonuclease Cas1c [Phycisphaera mikurensis]|uniref:CRISPR-associated endonuclease Cas1 n=1 Tax=Phycisphaera mikurensis (strain NBRC 102666 / KCTC 22515 / FYK2301M01) TaxID=1142394 RepID=I0IC60_PHYMF|nr:type I-C CRISPR-associated endonuclease Cas1c [Phycisphaera mikurensis]MBB6441933.1 CRISPR-associated protein Cas1 [Phycisphaera mikurensis]BAM02848.1 CRISPR-associated protein [Phycisphaera mikurensis NBRC 102666]